MFLLSIKYILLCSFITFNKLVSCHIIIIIIVCEYERTLSRLYIRGDELVGSLSKWNLSWTFTIKKMPTLLFFLMCFWHLQYILSYLGYFQRYLHEDGYFNAYIAPVYIPCFYLPEMYKTRVSMTSIILLF